MTPEQFIAHWQDNPLTERAGAQQHFDDLCDLLGVDKPRDPDNYCFERGAKKDGGGEGWADVWKRDCFGWENKKPNSDLSKALAQLREYAGNLGNPPLLIVCDRERIEIHTAFRGYPDEPRSILLQDIGEPANLQTLKWVFTDPDKLKPLKSNAAITREAAEEFAKLARAMRERSQRLPDAHNTDPQKVAHFLTQCIFCMFAEDEGLLHDSQTDNPEIFSKLLKAARHSPDKAADRIHKLFTAMRKKGGNYGDDDIAWFNGGLFKTIEIPALTESDLDILYHAAAAIDWRAIDPTIFGTLFERGLDPNCRAQLGAHYTDVATIQKLIEPLITRPLSAEWEQTKTQLEQGLAKADKTKGATQKQHRKTAENLYYAYLERLRNFRVLDAACGSGNFLYLALHALKDLEHKAQLDAEMLGLPKQIDVQAGTDNILGIEINEYAAELARVTVWIGDIQWCQRNGRPINKNPILRSLDGIEHRDALLNADGSEAQWPAADVIIGNPPFLGGSKKRGELGDDYFDALAKTFAKDRVPGGADLVCYWFDKARIQIEQGKAQGAGLVSTNSIRGGANRTVLDNICQTTHIFEAWPDEDWFDAGTAVRVSLVCFGNPPHPPFSKGGDSAKAGNLQTAAAPNSASEPAATGEPGSPSEMATMIKPASPFEKGGSRGIVPNGALLAGQPVAVIHADLTAGDGETAMDLTSAKPLKENARASFQGSQKIGAFDIPGELARQWLSLPNPNGKPNSEVLKPSWNGLDVTRRPRDGWIIDFGTSMSEQDASLYEMPFEYVVKHVKPERETNNREAYRKYWWRHGEPRIAMRGALSEWFRYIATPEVAKHRVFVWMNRQVLPDKKLIVVARSDDTTFGILHSRFHELWALAVCTWHGVGNDPRYTPTTCFETFPFPEGCTPWDTRPLADDEEDEFVEIPHMTLDPQTRQLVQMAPPYQLPPLRDPDSPAVVHWQRIAQASVQLNTLRENWLNPPEWVDWVMTPEEEKAGFPKRPVAKPGHEVDLKKRTLTNLYNQKPTWLVNAHQALDRAVANAYGWNDYTLDMPDAEILQRLLQLNLARAALEKS